MNSLRISARAIALSLAICLPSVHHALDNFHFYRASLFLGEPRLERPWMSTIDISILGGSTCLGRNSCGQKVCLLDIYGPYNMLDLGVGVPNKDLTNPVDIALTELAALPAGNCFANLSFQGRFSTQELVINAYQNFCRGFFGQMYLPVRHLSLQNVGYVDLSPGGPIGCCCPPVTGCPNINTPEWQNFLALFPQIMQKYQLCIGPASEKGVGDLSFYLGWTNNYQETEVLDYVDATFKLGILVPTGKQKNENLVFSLPLGYNGHMGFPLQFDGSIGSYDWLTIGGHIGAIFFCPKNYCNLRMKTSSKQSGFIKLASGNASIQAGTLWHAGAYFKADHLYRGLSLLLGFTYASRNNDRVTPQDCCIFDPFIVNTDLMFHGWSSNTLHLGVEYDFARQCHHVAPRIALFYDRIVSGKRVFNTNIIEGKIGIDVVWHFN